MPYQIVITKQAKKDIDALDVTVKKLLHKKLVYFSSLHDMKNVSKKLHNASIGEYRLRVGDYRLLFDLDKQKIVFLRVQHRKDVYR